MTRKAAGKAWEAVVVGGGPAGLAAGMHLSRAGYRTLLLERSRLGGQARLLGRIENYPGFPSGVWGSVLMDRWVRQARRWGLRIRKAAALELRREGERIVLRLSRGGRARSRSVILATGSGFKSLDVPGERRLKGCGVHHAAFEQAPEFRGRTVAIAGGGETAVHQALLLSRHAARVYLLSRGRRLRAHRLLLRRLRGRGNVVWLPRTTVTSVHGRGVLERLRLRRPSGAAELEASGLFVLIGGAPAGVPGAARLRRGVFTAGDASGTAFRQVAIAGGEGVRAAMRCIAYLENGVTTRPPRLKIRPPAGGANSRRPPPGGGRRFRWRGT